MKTWHDKADKVIANLCFQSWYETNHNRQGKRYKKHRPYAVPEVAADLVECIGTDNEERAKTIFLIHRF
jgi:hypothetical protein